METGIQIFRNHNDSRVIRAYIDKRNILQVNAEDAAYGLGYTIVGKNFIERINWGKVKSILKEFGYNVKKLGSDSYIPENMFYLLAMRADSPAAKEFQWWAADEVFPKIRQQGYYVADDFHAQLQQKNRQDGIVIRKGETSAIKLYIQYTRRQGDRRDEGKVYAYFSSLANKIVGVADGERDSATADQLKNLAIVENYIANFLLEGMARNKRYWQIELDLKINVANVARLALYKNPLLLK